MQLGGQCLDTGQVKLRCARHISDWSCRPGEQAYSSVKKGTNEFEDFLAFNTGSMAIIGLAPSRTQLVVAV